jgi:hypothetical protein
MEGTIQAHVTAPIVVHLMAPALEVPLGLLTQFVWTWPQTYGLPPWAWEDV